MIIRNIETTKGTVTKLEVESEDNRITNKKYEFFLKSLFLGKNDKIEDYLKLPSKSIIEVSIACWSKTQFPLLSFLFIAIKLPPFKYVKIGGNESSYN